MRAYADSSFLLRLVVSEPGTAEAIAEYRRLDRPVLFYLGLHALELENAIRQRAFHEARQRSSGNRRSIRRERDEALSRLERLIQRRAFLPVTLDLDSTLERARKLSASHTDRLGSRAIDTLHVACALDLQSELFLTCDVRQVKLAQAQGLKSILTGSA